MTVQGRQRREEALNVGIQSPQSGSLEVNALCQQGGSDLIRNPTNDAWCGFPLLDDGNKERYAKRSGALAGCPISPAKASR